MEKGGLYFAYWTYSNIQVSYLTYMNLLYIFCIFCISFIADYAYYYYCNPNLVDRVLAFKQQWWTSTWKWRPSCCWSNVTNWAAQCAAAHIAAAPAVIRLFRFYASLWREYRLHVFCYTRSGFSSARWTNCCIQWTCRRFDEVAYFTYWTYFAYISKMTNFS